MHAVPADSTRPQTLQARRRAPMVGTVLRISPMCSLYRMVVFPAASRPSMTTCKRHQHAEHDPLQKSSSPVHPARSAPASPCSRTACRTSCAWRSPYWPQLPLAPRIRGFLTSTLPDLTPAAYYSRLASPTRQHIAADVIIVVLLCLCRLACWAQGMRGRPCSRAEWAKLVAANVTIEMWIGQSWTLCSCLTSA